MDGEASSSGENRRPQRIFSSKLRFFRVLPCCSSLSSFSSDDDDADDDDGVGVDDRRIEKRGMMTIAIFAVVDFLVGFKVGSVCMYYLSGAIVIVP